jgi:hypothetical protein
MRVSTLVSSQGRPDAARSAEDGPGNPAHADADADADADAGAGEREVEQRPDGLPAGRAGGDGPFHLNLVRWRMVF